YTGNVSEGDTQTAQYQNLAYSTDKGRTWTQYAKNPVLDLKTKEFRDPNVFWYAPQKKWVMSVIKPTDHQAAFYESKNLKDWKLLSLFGPFGDTTRVWECPALLPVPIQNEAGKSKWVLFVSSGHPQKGYLGMQYFVGNFDGTKFTLDKENPKPIAPAVSNRFAGAVVDWGKDYYAAIQYNDLPGSQKNPVMIGWLNNWEYANKLPSTPFKGAMSLPRAVALKRTPEGLQLVQQPIANAVGLRGTKTTPENMKLTDQSRILRKSIPNTYELELEIAPGTARSVGIRLAKNGDEETVIRYVDGKLELDRRKSGDVAFSDRFPSVEYAPLSPQNGVIKLRIFVDKSVVEVFANDGERVITDLIFPSQSAGEITVFAEGGHAEFRNVAIWPLKSVPPSY
ncbi:MAG: GH32 C-terminal domain-containing protein, partial [Bacteroidetes bacterium]|nr:GH32 C-terminal domain-containing protein [Fibrella sp.]